MQVWIKALNGTVFPVYITYSTDGSWDMAEQIEQFCPDFHRMFQQLMKVEESTDSIPFFPYLETIHVQEADTFFLVMCCGVWVKHEDKNNCCHEIRFGPAHMDVMERRIEIERLGSLWLSGNNIYDTLESLLQTEIASVCDFPIYQQQAIIESSLDNMRFYVV